MARVLFPEFRDAYEATKYPFGEKASLQNRLGDLILEGAFLDAHLYPIGGKERLYLSRIAVEFGQATVSIGDVDHEELASGTIDLIHPGSFVRLADAYQRPAGLLVSEPSRLSIFSTWSHGIHPFEIEQTEFAATCCMPQPEVGVRGILLDDGSLITGTAWIVGGDGVVVRSDTQMVTLGCQSLTLDTIRVDVVGDPLFRRRLCDDYNLFDTPNPIRKIRVTDGVSTFTCLPDRYGNFQMRVHDLLSPSTVLRIRPDVGGLVIEAVGTPTGGTDA